MNFRDKAIAILEMALQEGEVLNFPTKPTGKHIEKFHEISNFVKNIEKIKNTHRKKMVNPLQNALNAAQISFDPKNVVGSKDKKNALYIVGAHTETSVQNKYPYAQINYTNHFNGQIAEIQSYINESEKRTENGKTRTTNAAIKSLRELRHVAQDVSAMTGGEIHIENSVHLNNFIKEFSPPLRKHADFISKSNALSTHKGNGQGGAEHTYVKGHIDQEHLEFFDDELTDEKMPILVEKINRISELENRHRADFENPVNPEIVNFKSVDTIVKNILQ